MTPPIMMPPQSGRSLAGWLVALAVAVSGCGDKPLAESSMVREVMVADLLEAAVQGEDQGVRVYRSENGWPADSFLDVKGRVRFRQGAGESAAGESAAVSFSVEVDGRQVLAHLIAAGEKRERFRARVPLDATLGGPAEVMLRIRPDDPGSSLGRWTRANIETRVATPRAPASGGPNLLFVVVDTLRADHCSLYGYSRPTTPALERLAASSLVFDQVMSQCSWTAPAVASMLTGLYPLQHGVVHGESLKHRFATFGETLQASGVTTFAVSTNPLIDAAAGYAQGVESFHHVPWKRAEEVNRLFVEWLPSVDGLRWFAYLHYTDPHSPYDAPEPQGSAFVDDGYGGIFRDPQIILKVRKQINFEGGTDQPIDHDDLEYLRALYDGEIRYWDRQFGELIETLRERGSLDDTIVIVTSDHGEEFREHGKLMHGHHLYEESVRVPLLIHAPRLPPERRSDLVETRALYRAVLQLMGVADLPLLPDDLLADRAGRRWPAFSHTVHKTGAGGRRQSVVAAVRDDDWKLIYWTRDGRSELFDLSSDAGEVTDAAGIRGELVERYRELLERWLATGPADAATGEAPVLDPEVLDKLRALGYVP